MSFVWLFVIAIYCLAFLCWMKANKEERDEAKKLEEQIKKNEMIKKQNQMYY